MPKTKGLTGKQDRFIEEYLVDLNATQSAIRAGYSEKTAYQIGFENLRKDYIRDAIQERIRELSSHARSGAQQLLRRIEGQGSVTAANVERKRGVVYLLKADNGLVKIGLTVNFGRRYAALNSQLPYALDIVTLIDCDDCVDLEKRLHEHFSDKRIRGEWFALDDDDVEWVKRESWD